MAFSRRFEVRRDPASRSVTSFATEEQLSPRRIAWHHLAPARPEIMTGCYFFDARPDVGRGAMGAWVFQRPGWPAQLAGEHVLGSSRALLVHLVGVGREEVAAALLEVAVP